jgi:hypothetical protein
MCDAIKFNYFIFGLISITYNLDNSNMQIQREVNSNTHTSRVEK